LFGGGVCWCHVWGNVSADTVNHVLSGGRWMMDGQSLEDRLRHLLFPHPDIANALGWRGRFRMQALLLNTVSARADHVKFVFPAAWTLAVLAWQIIEFGAGFAASGQLPYALDNLRWGADFLMRCRLSDTLIVAQVGPEQGLRCRVWAAWWALSRVCGLGWGRHAQ
jgi:hypothetical protein